MLRKHSAHNVFVDFHPEGIGDLLGDTQVAELGIAALHLNNGCDELRGGAFRPGFASLSQEEKSRRYLRSTNALWNLNSVEDLSIADSFEMRRRLTNCAVS